MLWSFHFSCAILFSHISCTVVFLYDRGQASFSYGSTPCSEFWDCVFAGGVFVRSGIVSIVNRNDPLR